ncbi:MAG: acyltransferase [Bacteroidaceae bacterium]|nr:acyltransferase [Bacteroidaceae bacterium]MBQ9294728.1 acyltransferase [Bacteroidaceae bacterium]
MNKTRYDILDGLRGVAALMVLLYHIFNDAKSFFVWPTPVGEFFHGFLGVDFFFILSGFVMGYAYDQQWGNGLNFGRFVRRRLVRLHPMVILGVLMGAIAFIIQGCTKWDGSEVAIETVMFCTLLGLFMIPSPSSLDVRGNTEIFPLNGPHWSLFIEYLGSLLYGLMLHRLSTKWLRVWVAGGIVSIAGFALLTNDGGIAYGWSSEPVNFMGGALRMLYAYPMGLLMARVFRERQPKPLHGHVFLLCSLALMVLLGLPFLGSKDTETIYQLVCIFSLFPTIIWYGARGSICGWKQQVVSFLGRLSYPLYAIHFPLIYLYIMWVERSGYTYIGHSHPWAAAFVTFACALLLATLSLLLYDEPLRRWLNRKTKAE